LNALALVEHRDRAVERIITRLHVLRDPVGVAIACVLDTEPGIARAARHIARHAAPEAVHGPERVPLRGISQPLSQ
jgi:hypothetical protein